MIPLKFILVLGHISPKLGKFEFLAVITSVIWGVLAIMYFLTVPLSPQVDLWDKVGFGEYFSS